MILSDRWAIVLAAGAGSRLRLLTTDERGVVTPKQFCSLYDGGPTLLEEALARAERHVARDRIVVVVAAEHEVFWRAELAHLPPQNVVVQPRNRGTAIGLLLPLLHIMSHDAEPSVLVLPSDHHVGNEAALAASVSVALERVARGDPGVVLLGMTPEGATPDFGWIVPVGGGDGVREVVGFVEKPAAPVARALLAQGGIWNTFLFAARGRTLLDLIEAAAPGVARDIDDALRLGGDSLDREYDVLPSLDLSHDVFGQAVRWLRVIRVPPCGWTDLGTPQRVRACLAQARSEAEGLEHRGPSALSLARCVRGHSAIA